MTKHLPELPEAYIEPQLELLKEALQHAPYPGYPARSERLVSPLTALGRTAANALIIPDGPWIVPGHNTFRTDNLQPSELAIDTLAREGYQLDSLGRPLHPWFRRMLENPGLGVVGGKGAYWKWGPNRTADSVVVHNSSLLLVERGDTGDWALPGGFIDGGEHAARAAKREVAEETGVRLDSMWGIPFYKGPVVDPRMTAHAWPETTAYFFSLPSQSPRPEPDGADDARRAEWVPLEEVEQLQLFGSHRFLARLALSQLAVVSA